MTIYHLILEATLGLTTFRFVTDYLEREQLSAGVRRGLLEDPPRRDPPHRLRGLVPARDGRGRPERRPRSVRETLRELLPSVAEALDAARRRARARLERLGVSTDEIREFALGGLPGAWTSSACRSQVSSAGSSRVRSGVPDRPDGRIATRYIRRVTESDSVVTEGVDRLGHRRGTGRVGDGLPPRRAGLEIRDRRREP